MLFGLVDTYPNNLSLAKFLTCFTSENVVFSLFLKTAPDPKVVVRVTLSSTLPMYSFASIMVDVPFFITGPKLHEMTSLSAEQEYDGWPAWKFTELKLTPGGRTSLTSG